VAEPQPVPVVDQDTRRDRGRERSGQVEHRAVRGRRQVRDREARSEDRGRAQGLPRGLGQEAEQAQDREAEARRQSRPGHRRPPVPRLDHVVVHEGRHQLGDEQGVAARPRDLGHQRVARLGREDVSHEVDDGPVGQLAELDGAGAARSKALSARSRS
jgi:hypothetical protein